MHHSSAGRRSELKRRELALLSICPPQPAPNRSLPKSPTAPAGGTHRRRPAPGSPGPCHFSQHDEAIGGDAAEGVQRFLRYFLTVQVELDLEEAHGHVHLGGRWKEEGWSPTTRWGNHLKTIIPPAQFPGCCCYYWCVFNEQMDQGGSGISFSMCCVCCTTLRFSLIFPPPLLGRSFAGVVALNNSIFRTS